MKDYSGARQVLDLLREKRGSYVSGEILARELGISRTYVWKCINVLREQGYAIRSSTNKGYALDSEPERLDAQSVASFLTRGADCYAPFIKVYNKLPSTNAEAKQAALDGAPHGTVIIADSQQSGKGRFSREFFSPPGTGLYMSVLLRPQVVPAMQSTLITIGAACAVCDAINACTDGRAGIKWVNDILIDGKKVCGILTEGVADLESGTLGWAVVGIGINVYEPRCGFPSYLKGKAGALFSHPRDADMRARLCADIASRLLSPEFSCDGKKLINAYRQRLCMLGERVMVHSASSEYEAAAVDIDDNGALVVKKDDGSTHLLAAGEVSLSGIPELSTDNRE